MWSWWPGFLPASFGPLVGRPGWPLLFFFCRWAGLPRGPLFWGGCPLIFFLFSGLLLSSRGRVEASGKRRGGASVKGHHCRTPSPRSFLRRAVEAGGHLRVPPPPETSFLCRCGGGCREWLRGTSLKFLFDVEGVTTVARAPMGSVGWREGTPSPLISWKPTLGYNILRECWATRRGLPPLYQAWW